MTRKYDDYETGNRFDAACTNSLRSDPYQRQAAAYPTINLSGYNVPCPTYDQLNQIHGMQTYQPHTQYDASSLAHDHMLNQIYSAEAHQRDHHHPAASTRIVGQQTNHYDYHQPDPYKVFSPAQNKVFVFDGREWNEFSLETVVSEHIPCQESLRGGT